MQESKDEECTYDKVWAMYGVDRYDFHLHDRSNARRRGGKVQHRGRKHARSSESTSQVV